MIRYGRGLLLLAFTLIFVADSIPIESSAEQNDEQQQQQQPVENWQLIPDGNWNMHMVDVNRMDFEAIEPAFNAQQEVAFRLFTRRNNNWAQNIGLNNQQELRNSNFNRNHPTRFIIHGWNNDAGSDVNVRIRSAYMQRGEFNVIVVDWGRGANTINYVSARNRVTAVADVVAQFLRFLNGNAGLSYGNVIMVGHSLGAHISGLTGKRVRGIGAIVALDPALPLFSMDRHQERVHSSDAGYVESIQTDVGRLGMYDPVGDASHYPNWGGPHPGCGIDMAGTCGHSRAHEFFAESINSGRGFVASRCRDFNEIRNKRCTSTGSSRMGGEPLNRSANGVFYCQTNSQSPFARG